MPYHDRQEIDSIRAQADIVDVIGHYVTLTKKGKEYTGICPFHDDHDPSMRVNPDKQIYKCFVCGAGGNVFTFIQNIEKISFIRAVKKVADLAGVPFHVQEPEQVKADPLQPCYHSLEVFLEYCRYILKSPDGRSALEYLRERKFSDEIIDRFGLGFAPAAGQLHSFFQAKKLSAALLKAAGLMQQETGYPFFASRIVIPIHDPSGRPVGITARKLPQDQSDSPKYINTPSSKIYEKGNFVFNYHRAREHVRKEGYAVLTEGAMDVLGLEKAGIHTGIAMLGTACTPAQIELLHRLQVTIRVFYDNDPAGRKAAWKFGSAALKAGLSFVIVNNTMDKDPDEIFAAHGAEAVRRIVDKTISFTEFAFSYLQTQYNLDNYEDKHTFARTMADLIQYHTDVHEQNSWFSQLKELTGLEYSASTGARETGSFRKQPNAVWKGRYKNAVPALTDTSIPVIDEGRLAAEKAVLASMLCHRKYADRFKVEIGFFKNAACQQLSLYIYDAYRNCEVLSGPALLDQIEEKECRDLLLDLLDVEESLISDDLYWDSLDKIREFSMKDSMNNLSRQIRETENAQEKITLLRRQKELIKQLNELRQRKEVEQ